MKKNKCCNSVEQYRIIAKYGDKPLISCMENVIRRLLIQSVESAKEAGK